MSQDDFAKFVLDANLETFFTNKIMLQKLKKFAELVSKAERESCAIICDSYAENSSSPMNFAENCAVTIRARK